MANRQRLFSVAEMSAVTEYRKRAIKDKVQELDSNYLLNVSEDDLVQSLKSEYWIEVPILREEAIEIIDQQETEIDVSHDFNRGFFGNEGPFYVPGTRITISVPFDGDVQFFNFRPSLNTNAIHVDAITGQELRLAYQQPSDALNPETIKQECNQTLAHIKEVLQSILEKAVQFNAELDSVIRGEISERKKRLLAASGLASSLGFPMRKRTGVRTTYAVPVARRKPKIERPNACNTSFQPEPTLANEEYENILAIMENMVLVMEQSPSAFEQMQEEDLRTHFLVQLNAQYEGQATGETFNFHGKTDIIIRAEAKNVFIAECKFWKGEQQFLATIDQLLSYLSWRDTKTAVVIFNRNVNFSDVLSKIADATPTHNCFKRDLGKSGESTFRYVFHQPEDNNRELLLTVMAFNVPTNRKA